ncbi:hypothetical protein Tco_1042754 [Tanacetum coccineum]|uniref:Uncharacterized protein n=1 Tax=Tanacetum coccineum TaxID=301880 RepID=A0ABQ5GKP1_9ASTR
MTVGNKQMLCNVLEGSNKAQEAKTVVLNGGTHTERRLLQMILEDRDFKMWIYNSNGTGLILLSKKQRMTEVYKSKNQKDLEEIIKKSTPKCGALYILCGVLKSGDREFNSRAKCGALLMKYGVLAPAVTKNPFNHGIEVETFHLSFAFTTHDSGGVSEPINSGLISEFTHNATTTITTNQGKEENHQREDELA